jgi:nucleotide-binding universal stress UspA family protein
MYRRILVCTDGSALAQSAACEGVQLAAKLGASVVALLVTPPFEPPKGYETSPLAEQIERHVRESKAAAKRWLGAIAEDASAAGVRCETLHIGHYPPAETIVETANDKRCDLIVMGSHGRGALGQMMLGSVTTRVAATCSVPLLIVRQPSRQRRRTTGVKRRGARAA